MQDKTTLGISEPFRQYIEALVEEVVLEGKSFDEQKEWLRNYSEAEGVDYEAFEKNLMEFFATIEEYRLHKSKPLEHYAKTLGENCFFDERAVDSLLLNMNDITKKQREEIGRKVKEIIADRFNVEESVLTESTDFIKDLGADSLEIVELVMDFERVFGLAVDDDESVDDIYTVGDVIDKVVEILGRKIGEIKL